MSVTLLDGSNYITLPNPELSNSQDVTLKAYFRKSRIGHVRTTKQTSVKNILVMRFILSYSLMNNLAWILNETRKDDTNRLYTLIDHNGTSWYAEIINDPLSDATISDTQSEVTLRMQVTLIS